MNDQNDNIDAKVIEIIASRLGIPANTITRDSYLYDDLNSSKLEIADIIQTLEDKYNLKFNIEDIKNFEKVADLIEYLIDNEQ